MIIDNASILEANTILLKNRRISKTFKNIHLLDSIELANGGYNDTEGYQIFTPKFIVKDILKGEIWKDMKLNGLDTLNIIQNVFHLN